MEVIKLLQNYLTEYPVLWAVMFVFLTVIAEMIPLFIQKKFEAKTAIIALVISSVLTACFAAAFSILFPVPTIKNKSDVIPDDIVRSPFKIILYDYFGEYHYEKSNERNFIFDILDKMVTDIHITNEDFDVEFSEYQIERNEHNEIIYVFDNIPAGNYTVSVSMDGYLVRNEHTSLEGSGRSVNDLTQTYWWEMALIMEKLELDNPSYMSIRFFDTDYEPMENLKYEIISSPLEKDFYHTYPTATNSEGRCEENISIVPNTGFWIAYINPYDGEEYTFYITAKIDSNVNWCDTILVLKSNGEIEQTSPSIIWYQ